MERKDRRKKDEGSTAKKERIDKKKRKRCGKKIKLIKEKVRKQDGGP